MSAALIVKAIAPGKIILSGEYAVVFGRPALVSAIARFAAAEVRPRDDPCIEMITQFGRARYRPADLRRRLADARARFDRFLQGSLPITEVVADKAEFVALGWPLLNEQFDLPSGVSLHVVSELPPGSGMGSSAAVATAALHALAGWGGRRLDAETCYLLALDLERFQHGYPSGVDPFVASHGGLIRYQKDVDPVELHAPKSSFHLVHTGPPESTTGECLDQVRRAFGRSSIWDAFATACRRIESALADGDADELREGVRANHRLLCQIGVVPDDVAAWIASVEAGGGAAKICGAGSVRGAGGGIVWVVDDIPNSLIQAPGYMRLDVRGRRNGAQLID